MNEKIQQLAHEAGLPTYNPEGIPTKLEKFAELIVRECIRKIEDIAESSNDPQPIYRVAVELLEHFGVEE